MAVVWVLLVSCCPVPTCERGRSLKRFLHLCFRELFYSINAQPAKTVHDFCTRTLTLPSSPRGMFFCLLWETSRLQTLLLNPFVVQITHVFKFVDFIMVSGRLISQITVKNDIISILYTKETLRNRGTCVTVRKPRMSRRIMIMGPFLTLCFAD